MTYSEFVEEWAKTDVNSQGTALPKRTFADCLRAIEETFGIEISSDARNGYRYRIGNREWLEKDNIKDWLLSAFAVNNLLQDSKNLRERVLYEPVPSGNTYLLKILEAMKNDHIILMVYQDFYDEMPQDIMLEPYCVKIFKQRWYIIGVDRNDPENNNNASKRHIRRYALDRIKRLEATDEKFKIPCDFSAKSYFDDAFGIIVDHEDFSTELIRLKVSDINHRRQYIRSLPLHKSQREVEKYSDYSIFTVKVMPSYDFIQHILSMGNEVEILSPQYVREEIIWLVKSMADKYGISP